MSDFWNLPDGVEEIVPPLSTNLEKTKTELLDYFQNKGFDLIFTPPVEYSDSIGGLANEELSRSSFQFSDTNSERSLALRPDISQQVATCCEISGLKARDLSEFVSENWKLDLDNSSFARPPIESEYSTGGVKMRSKPLF